MHIPAFRLGDVRGIYPDEIDADFAMKFAQAFCQRFSIDGTVATGRDMRQSSPELQDALNAGLTLSGIKVENLGLCSTELGYFASTMPDIAAVIIVTASHNPAKYNGFKCVLQNGEAVSFNTGLSDVMALMTTEVKIPNRRSKRRSEGGIRPVNYLPLYIAYLEAHFDSNSLDVGRIALNGLNGTAVTLAAHLSETFSLPVTWYRKEPGPIPVDGADPVNPKLVAQMSGYMRGQNYALGVAWDGDCDRCVFFDSEGKLVPTYYIIGLMSEYFLQRHKGAAIVFDSKLAWNTLDVCARNGGQAIVSETGHAFVKQKMRASAAVYGGELSSHHYFSDFFNCDSGMFAWLKMVEIISISGISIDKMVAERRELFPSTPEISIALDNPNLVFKEIDAYYKKMAVKVDYFDGLAYEMPNGWRFSLRKSKTEPLVRINFESRGEPKLLLDAAADVLSRLVPYGAESKNWQDLLYIQ